MAEDLAEVIYEEEESRRQWAALLCSHGIITHGSGEQKDPPVPPPTPQEKTPPPEPPEPPVPEPWNRPLSKKIIDEWTRRR